MEDGLRVLVTRYYPRGIKRERFGLWIRELSPSAELLRSYRAKEIGWRKFSADFTNELLGNPESQRAMRNLLDLTKEGNVTLLCYERAGENCHRLILERLLLKEKKRPHATRSGESIRRTSAMAEEIENRT